MTLNNFEQTFLDTMTYLVYLAIFTTHLGVVEQREEVIYGLDRYPSLKVWYTVHHQISVSSLNTFPMAIFPGELGLAGCFSDSPFPFIPPRGLRHPGTLWAPGGKNRPAPFPGRMSQKATKRGLCLSCLWPRFLLSVFAVH